MRRRRKNSSQLASKFTLQRTCSASFGNASDFFYASVIQSSWNPTPGSGASGLSAPPPPLRAGVDILLAPIPSPKQSSGLLGGISVKRKAAK